MVKKVPDYREPKYSQCSQYPKMRPYLHQFVCFYTTLLQTILPSVPMSTKVIFSCVSQKDSEWILLNFPIQITLFLTLVCEKQILNQGEYQDYMHSLQILKFPSLFSHKYR